MKGQSATKANSTPHNLPRNAPKQIQFLSERLPHSHKKGRAKLSISLALPCLDCMCITLAPRHSPGRQTTPIRLQESDNDKETTRHTPNTLPTICAACVAVHLCKHTHSLTGSLLSTPWSVQLRADSIAQAFGCLLQRTHTLQRHTRWRGSCCCRPLLLPNKHQPPTRLLSCCWQWRRLRHNPGAPSAGRN